MREVDIVIAQRLTTSVPLIAQISQYIIAAGGKRLRPALLLLIAGALGHQGKNKYILAAVVEIVRSTGALDVARAAAHAEAQRAIDALASLPSNAYTASLLQLASQLLERRT